MRKTLLMAATCLGAAVSSAAPVLSTCRVIGVETEARCGTVKRPLDPGVPGGTQIDVHFAVLPALARNRKPDPVFFFAGGPGQSAIELAGFVSRLLVRLTNRRDVVLIDQRGTGRSAPLHCDAAVPTQLLRESADLDLQERRLADCREALRKLPHGDLRQYTTTIAMQDADAVRAALGAERINLVGVSYGTRAVLEYQRRFPGHVRRAVIDGVAPPDMALPGAFSTDNQAALDAVFQACVAEVACAARHPHLARDWQSMLASLPREVTLRHPVTGKPERLWLTRDGVLSLVRQPLYAPARASALPLALGEAAQGRFEALLGLGMSPGGGRRSPAQGMHFSVVCAEDLPRLAASADAPGADFGNAFADFYRRVCRDWPHGEVPAAFYTLAPAGGPTWVLSGGIDPATPPRHGQRVATALGAKARHTVVPHAGHGVLGIGCMRDLLFRFIDADSDEAALALDAGCITAIPRPAAFALPASAR